MKENFATKIYGHSYLNHKIIGGIIHDILIDFNISKISFAQFQCIMIL
jgi:hypothetical protein